jgi:hypothetical protein
VSGSMQVMAVDGSAILDYPAVIRALRSIYAHDEVSDVITSPPPSSMSSVQVRPRDASSFSVRLEPDGSGCGIDGLPPQNDRVVVALRAEIPADAGRVVAIDLMNVENFAELPAGITLEQLEAAWRPLAEFDETV